MQQEFVQLNILYNKPGDDELLIALLSDKGYLGFEEREGNEMRAFIDLNDFDETVLSGITSTLGFQWTKSILPKTNWNKEWESNFQPVLIDNYCGVRAEFHEPLTNVMHEIIITPKMSFGTGHHATTYMMIKSLEDINVKNKKVFDFGTGTGVLAILAEKEGASEIFAIDNDEWSVINATENISKNNASRIKVLQSDNPDCQQKFDTILANINKHIILESLPALSKQLNSQGIIICSGFIQQDADDILATATKCKLLLKEKKNKDNWVCMILQLS